MTDLVQLVIACPGSTNYYELENVNTAITMKFEQILLFYRARAERPLWVIVPIATFGRFLFIARES